MILVLPLISGLAALSFPFLEVQRSATNVGHVEGNLVSTLDWRSQPKNSAKGTQDLTGDPKGHPRKPLGAPPPHRGALAPSGPQWHLQVPWPSP